MSDIFNPLRVTPPPRWMHKLTFRNSVFFLRGSERRRLLIEFGNRRREMELMAGSEVTKSQTNFFATSSVKISHIFCEITHIFDQYFCAKLMYV